MRELKQVRVAHSVQAHRLAEAATDLEMATRRHANAAAAVRQTAEENATLSERNLDLERRIREMVWGRMQYFILS